MSRVAFDLLTQPVDMGFQCVGRNPGIVAPDVLQQRFAPNRLLASAVKELDD